LRWREEGSTHGVGVALIECDKSVIGWRLQKKLNIFRVCRLSKMNWKWLLQLG